MQSGLEMEKLEAALQENFEKAAAPVAANDDGAQADVQPAEAAPVLEAESADTSVEVHIPDPAPEITVDAAPGQHNQETNNDNEND
jgi:segregation and condensation protein B